MEEESHSIRTFRRGSLLIQPPLHPYANLRNGPNPIPPPPLYTSFSPNLAVTFWSPTDIGVSVVQTDWEARCWNQTLYLRRADV